MMIICIWKNHTRTKRERDGLDGHFCSENGTSTPRPNRVCVRKCVTFLAYLFSLFERE